MVVVVGMFVFMSYCIVVSRLGVCFMSYEVLFLGFKGDLKNFFFLGFLSDSLVFKVNVCLKFIYFWSKFISIFDVFVVLVECLVEILVNVFCMLILVLIFYL